MIDVVVQLKDGDVLARFRFPDRVTEWRIQVQDRWYKVVEVREKPQGQDLIVVPE